MINIIFYYYCHVIRVMYHSNSLLTPAIYSQQYTAFNLAIDNDQKALLSTAKGRFRLYISATYHSYVLSICHLYVVAYYPYVTLMMSMCYSSCYS